MLQGWPTQRHDKKSAKVNQNSYYFYFEIDFVTLNPDDNGGFDRDGIHKETGTAFDKNGFDYDGYDKEGYDAEGHDKGGYDKSGFEEEGYDREGNTRDYYKIKKEEEKEYTDNCVSQTFEQEAETGLHDDYDDD